MSSSAFLIDPSIVFIADASVVINLNASGYARQIIETIASKILVPSNAYAELEMGKKFGHNDSDRLDELVAEKVVQIVHMGVQALAVYKSLIDGSRGITLDDGEAATIAIAVEQNALALIDEKKARRMCQDSFPTTKIGCTAQILLNAGLLGKAVQIEATVNALKIGRMRVPTEFMTAIVDLIGSQEAENCPSIPRPKTRAAN